MRTTKFAPLCAAALLCSAGANAATIVNGSFEDGVNPGSYHQVNAGDSTSITGWTVTSGSVDYIGSYWTAAEGSRSIDLAGSSLGTLAQTFDTVVGSTYRISYFISKNPDGGAATRTGTITAGGNTGGFSYSASNNRQDMNWVQQTFDFTATGATTTLSFAADDSAGCCFGPALDNVSIAAVPEPATWALFILGFGVVGATLRRARPARVALTFS